MVNDGKYDGEMSTTHPESKSSVKIQQATSAENRLGRKVGWRTKKRREGKKNERKSAGGGPRGMRAGRRRDERADTARLLISEPGRDIRRLDYGVGTHCSGAPARQPATGSSGASS